VYFLAAILHLAFLTLDKYPPSKFDAELLIESFKDYKIEARTVDWHSTDTNWSDFDAVFVFSTWDYHYYYPEFLKLLQNFEEKGIKVYNPPSLLRWNSCKTYLQDLAHLNLKTIETVYISYAELDHLKSILIENGWDDCVIKPQISASAYHTYRFNLSNIESTIEFLKNYDEPYMIQPFAEEIISEGEWSFIFFDNEYSHCLLKKPKDSDFKVQGGQKIPITPPEWMLKEAQHIVDTMNLSACFSRIDVIRRNDELIIMEIELIEPDLFLRLFPKSADRFAKKMSEKLLNSNVD